MKWCCKCQASKPDDEFHKSSSGASYCIPCKSAVNQAYANKRKDKIAADHKTRKYGLPPPEYSLLLARQDHQCAICLQKLTPGKRTHIDHHHQSGKVRAILCYNCNLLLGHSKEQIHILQSAITYLIKHNSEIPLRNGGESLHSPQPIDFDHICLRLASAGNRANF